MAIPLARAVLTAALLTLTLASSPVAGQGMPSCASKLAPCLQYMNSTATPPASCCGPLSDAAANETACLCNLFGNKALLKAFNVDPEKGFQLGKRCGITADKSTCAMLASPPSGLPSCASKLAPCLSYMNSTAPPASCCAPLSDAAANETACLCGLLSNKAVLKAFNVEPAEGFQLAKRCKITADESTCSKIASTGSGSLPCKYFNTQL